MSSVLKSVAVTAFAVQTLEGETWKGMCWWAIDCIKNSKTLDDMRKEMSVVEAQMKKDYDTTAMPSAWRSAKSVVLAAIDGNVALLVRGNVLGKTEVETQIKAAHLAKIVTVTVDALSEYMKVALEAEERWAGLTPTAKLKVPANLKWE